MKKQKNFLMRFIFAALFVFGPQVYATQSVISDPSAGSCSDVAPTNGGTGTCAISNVTAFQPSETVTFTTTTAGPLSTVTVIGSVSGALSAITTGSSQTVYDSFGFPRFTVTLSDGGTAYSTGDNFSFAATAGTELKKTTFDAFTLTQICSNGCAATVPVLLANGSVSAPSLSFTNSSGSGLYFVGTNSIGIATGGTNALTFTSAQVGAFSTGSTSPYFQSSTANAASAGQIRLANADTIKFRNATNAADIALGVGSTNSFPAYGGVDLVNISGSQTLTNKTLTSPIISTISNTGTLTLPTSTDTIVARATTDTLTNKTLTTPIINGVTDASSAASGVVGEIIEYSQSTLTNMPAASGAYGDVQTVALTAGDWDCSMAAIYDANGGTLTSVFLVLGTATGNNNTGSLNGKTNLIYVAPAFSDATLTSPTFRISISGSTNYFLKVRGGYTIATPQYAFYFSARRVR